ncbi:hypothetical protein P8C59_004594 [Phyllachora maydis]|uniref:NADP-dependent oxidoreductase domain-containing protein n=1 Tax=Phyllachora maydis TaxID=1825666 RepID=A0AAD9I304_9PEZI|nr:hypothetical protein P8C59_004594 [Phyllachora maydis]
MWRRCLAIRRVMPQNNFHRTRSRRPCTTFWFLVEGLLGHCAREASSSFDFYAAWRDLHGWVHEPGRNKAFHGGSGTETSRMSLINPQLHAQRSLELRHFREALPCLKDRYKTRGTFMSVRLLESIHGDSEASIGQWLVADPEKRKDIFLATKFGGINNPDGSYGFRGDAAFVPIAWERNSRDMGVDVIDLYYPHRLDGLTPIEHIME